MSCNKIDEVIDKYLDECELDDLAILAYDNCSNCGGQGYYYDDPSPPGLFMSSGYYTHVCDCLNLDIIEDLIK
tara:strand:+ start:819 stop:1037 length:219 start_codon:yes stop_codon:yes gene_type:complete